MAATATTTMTTEQPDEVTYEDQLKVNEFSRNNARMNELTQEIKARKSSLETLQDAADECELATEEGDIKLVLGESFFDIDDEFASDHLAKLMKVRGCVLTADKLVFRCLAARVYGRWSDCWAR